MSVQLQPAEIELRIVTDAAERQLAAFREQVKMDGEIGDFEAGEGSAQAPAKMIERLKEAKEEEESKSWGQREAFFKPFAQGPPPRIHTEVAAWATQKVWDGVDAVHGRRIVESAGNFITGIHKTLQEGRITAMTDAALIAASPMLGEVPGLGGVDDATARTISGIVRAGAEVARWSALYAPSGEAVRHTRKSMENALSPLGDIIDPETQEAKYDAGFLSKVASDAVSGFDFNREGIINAESGMKASMQTLSQVTRMGTALFRNNLGQQFDNLDTVDFLSEYASRSYDWNKAQEKMKMEADIEGTRYFISNVSNIIVDKLGLTGSQLE